LNLFTREFGGSGTPVLILHGLFGSSKNWIGTGRYLSGFSRCFAVDQRNHGDSPHCESHTLTDMVEDLAQWLEQWGIEQPVLVGHSMGGLVAMAFSLAYPERVRGLLVVDILPRAYKPDFSREFAALSLDLSPYTSRRQIDEAMEKIIPDPEVRQFLQMNVERSDNGFRWKLNVPALKNSPLLQGTDLSVHKSGYHGPALLVAGGRSPFSPKKDRPLFNRLFPAGRIEVLEECGHWLHYVCSHDFQALLKGFIEKIEG